VAANPTLPLSGRQGDYGGVAKSGLWLVHSRGLFEEWPPNRVLIEVIICVEEQQTTPLAQV
jgi:hypothetical protein